MFLDPRSIDMDEHNAQAVESRQQKATLSCLESDRPASPPVADAPDLVISFSQDGGIHRATTANGYSFPIGKRVSYKDDMHRIGLHHPASLLPSLAALGRYKAADFTSRFGRFAYLIEPTLTAEGGGRFATLNTYDRAAFTFGAPQLAAHTPGENLILYFRALLALPNAGAHFPDLALRDDGTGAMRVHKISGNVNLEKSESVTRPNGIVERQLKRFMTYLNPSPTAVDKAELLAAARLMNWLRIDPAAREAQIAVFIASVKAKLREALVKAPALQGKPWPVALWVMDIRHQGRARFSVINAAASKPDPEAALAAIGSGTYPNRIKDVKAGVAKLKQSGMLDGFDPWNGI
jgi:hypothetical protein